MSDNSIDYNREKFELFLNSGIDEVTAYELAYNVTNDEAKLAIKKEQYDYLVQSGISEQTAHKVIFEEDEITSDKTI